MPPGVKENRSGTARSRVNLHVKQCASMGGCVYGDACFLPVLVEYSVIMCSRCSGLSQEHGHVSRLKGQIQTFVESNVGREKTCHVQVTQSPNLRFFYMNVVNPISKSP